MTYLMVIALVGLIAERTIYYTLLEGGIIERENAIEKLNRVAPHKARLLNLPQITAQRQSQQQAGQKKSNDTKLSEAVVSVQDTLDVLAYELLNKGNPNKAQDKLTQLSKDLQKYDQQAIVDFNKTEAHIEKYQLADFIKQRHIDMVTNYHNEMDALLSHLNTIKNTEDRDDKVDAVLAARKQLEDKQLKRSQQPFDPNNLPFKSAQPNPDNKPKTTEKEFTSAGLFNNPNPQYAALGNFTYDNLAGANNPEYMAETDEVVITDTIRAKALELNHDPVKIYHWVLNNIEWLPTWGSMQDSDITLGSLKGNAFDIASLHIALLRASQIPARYVHGTIDVPEDRYRNWVGGFNSIDAAGDFASSGGIPTTAILGGGKVEKIRMEHIWVEAAIDYAPSRGAINKDADSWVQMDPSYKQYEFLQGLDVEQLNGIDEQVLAQSFIDSGTVNEQEGWVAGFDPTILQDAQFQAQTTLEDYITNNMVDPTVADVIGGRRTIIKQHPALPSSLQNRIVVFGTRYGSVPSALKQTMTFSFGRDILGYPQNPVTIAWPKLNNHKVTLSFNPATQEDEQALLSLLPEGEITDINQLQTSIPSYLINVIPELKIDGVLVGVGNTVSLGADVDFGFDTHLVGGGVTPKRYMLPAGSFLSIVAIAGSVSATALSALQAKLIDTKNKLQLADPTFIDTLSREDLLGDMFHAGSLGYYARYIGVSYLSGLQVGAHHILAAGTGSFGYEPKVSYFFGIPKSLNPGGIALNKPIINIVGTNDGVNEAKKNYVQQIGLMSSALEHITPEKMFADENNSSEAVSAVKALQKAAQSGQRIYLITQQNMTTVLPNVHHSSDTIDEITNALNAGKEVMTHTDAIQVPGWSGAGYIIIEPETGEGAYRISGGVNGGFITGVLLGNAVNMLLVLVNGPLLATPFGQAMLLLVIAQFALALANIIAFDLNLDCVALGLLTVGTGTLVAARSGLLLVKHWAVVLGASLSDVSAAISLISSPVDGTGLECGS